MGAAISVSSELAKKYSQKFISGSVDDEAARNIYLGALQIKMLAVDIENEAFKSLSALLDGKPEDSEKWRAQMIEHLGLVKSAMVFISTAINGKKELEKND